MRYTYKEHFHDSNMSSLNSDIKILLLSKTSYDKSVSGNNILQKKIFNIDELDGISTPKSASSCVCSRNVTVTDTPGLMDGISSEHIKDAIIRYLSTWTSGYDAIIIVFRFPVRMTPEEVQSIQLIKSIIGEDNLKKYGFLLFTNGASFKNNPEETFEEYLDAEVNAHHNYQNRPQETLGKLITDVKRRCVLIDNDVSDINEIESFLKQIEHVKFLNSYKLYTRISFWGDRKLQKKVILGGLVMLGVIGFVVIIVAATKGL